MASGSRYTPLAEDDFESKDPGPHTHPAPSLAHIHPASPTATLQAYPEIQWIYAGVKHDSLENAIRASANSLGITNPAYVDWTISVTRDITQREIVNVYNILGSKIYEHRNDFLNESDTTHATFKELDMSMTGLHTKADTAGNLALKAVEENKQLTAELVAVNADLEVLNRNNTELVKRYKELAAKFIQLEQGLATHTTLGNHPSTRATKAQTSLLYLEGGAHDYVEDYVETASNGGTLGSWTDFVNRLKAGYRQLAPEKTAQTSLEEWCSKPRSTVIQFAENFRHCWQQWCDLVDNGELGADSPDRTKPHPGLKHKPKRLVTIRTKEQVGKNSQILMVITAMRQVNPMLILTKWEHYLDWSPPRDPNVMDVDAMRKPERLSKEQLEWLDKKLCFRCGKHKFTTGQNCRNPQYTGYYELPDMKKQPAAPTKVRTLDTADEDKWEYIRQALEEFETTKGKGKGKAPETETAARIVEVKESEEEFLERVL
ncbi:hypothetical protein DICSQDRAFT_171450 [Dichomitus squalens LYAD-421 SS1]|uniref:Retrotransposon gag domain-containing protein n=1 Tax=Dichomitus squalens (strain LYAD-421) TaxID=732165 RepID=R7SYA3_DICSQ|nr:uncharacterized protein DICSQDRAFT_171450 [Dichomitus squalens LYAD-421 SS1]EJF59967.1 hypothetical protein DICSQDRAFT_171450 [Dichomitus squalens LYAD-421 SS1]